MIRIEFLCSSHRIYKSVEVEVSDLEPVTIFETVHKNAPFIEDQLGEIAFHVYDFVDQDVDERHSYEFMFGTLLITPIRDIGQAMTLTNRRDIEYIYLYDEHSLFERPVEVGLFSKIALSSVYGISCIKEV